MPLFVPTLSPLNASPGLFNFGPTKLSKWRVAVASMNAGTSNARVAFLGDSTTRGTGAAADPLEAINAVPVKVRQRLTALGYVAQNESIWGSGNGTLANLDNRIVLGTSWTDVGASGMVGGRFINGTGTGTTTFTPVTDCDTFDVWHYQNSAGGFTINLDGGSTLATVNTAGAAGLIKTTVTGSLAAHTLRIVQTSGTVNLAAIECYNSAAKRLLVRNWGWASSQASNWATNTLPYHPPTAIPVYGNDLVIINLGINSWNNGAAVASFTTSMQTLMTACATAGSMILMTPYPSAISIATLAKQATYVAAMYALASQYDCPLIDLWTTWGSYETYQPLGFYTDTIHPAATGYADATSMVNSALLTTIGA